MASLYLARASVEMVVGDALFQLRIPSGGQANGLREDSGQAGAGDAMQTFVPPFIGGDFQAWNGGGGVLHLADLLFESEARYQVDGTLFGGKIGV